MKHLFSITLLLLVSCSMFSARLADNLVCLFTNGSLSVKRIEYNNDATIITFESTDKTGPSLTIGHGIYVVDDNGVRHHAVGSLGIDLDSVRTITSDNNIQFSVIFEPVEESNVALDVIDPGRFSIFGIHDRGITLGIPKIKDGLSSTDEVSDDLFQPREVIIEGIIHDADSKYQKLYIMNNETLETNFEQPSSTIDESGKFTITFTMLRPKLARLVTDKGGRLTKIFIRPGDHLFVEIHDKSEGLETKVVNRSGRNAYQKLTNIESGLWCRSFNYLSNLIGDSQRKAFNTYNPEEHWNIMMDDYKQNLLFADYICWHNKLSAFENRMYLEEIEMFYGWMLCELEAQIYNVVYTDAASDSDSDLSFKIDDVLNEGFYAMTKDISPDSPTLMYGEYCGSLSHLFDSYLAKKLCDSIPEAETNYCERMLKTQMDVIHRITGWDEESLLMQHNAILSMNVMFTNCKNVKKYRTAHAEELKQLYEATRKRIKNPYLLKQLDTLYERNMTD